MKNQNQSNVRTGNEGIVKFLLECGEKVNVKNIYENTSFHYLTIDTELLARIKKNAEAKRLTQVSPAPALNSKSR